jgi:two-component system, NtrC family, sensor histidine kinase GlrK
LRIVYPKSFLTLLLIGFSLVAFPFLLAFANATLYLDDITQQSRVAVKQAVQATRDSRALVEHLNLMERVTRQYLVLGDTALIDSFIAAHHKFDDTAAALGKLPLKKEQHNVLNEVSTKVDRIAAQMAMGDPNTLRQLLPEFASLFEQVNDILNESNRMIDRETASLQTSAENAQRALMWQALSLIPFALVVTMAITYLIARPLSQIDNAINDIGSGKLSEKIQVSGPEDLRKLGNRLDWLRAQLAELEEQKSRFLREVSHELKTPLTAIREGAELLNEGVGGQLSGQQKEIATILRENSLRLQRLIESLLNYSATRFQTEPIKKAVSLHTVLQRVLDDHALPISSRQLRLISRIGETLLPGDEARLSTLCDNLLSNAIKFSPQGGTIQISLQTRDNQARLDVLDNGPGIAVEDRAHLFEPFYQGCTPQEGHVKGSGLGLSIARDCVLAHGGNIAIMDNPTWRGAHFRVILPMHPMEADEDEIV